ncbi:MAG: response regulator transcription factor [Bacteroidetes bacterium]|nr:response regulator transcription factor [Bacteroidota bacterium]MDA0973186.1 response regulator transcription factor [Bacteroidota bacterium]
MKEHKDIQILLVEDDPNLGLLLQEYLTVKGYHVQLERDGEAGWRRFRKGGHHFIILDVMMPKKDGFTLAKDIRKMDGDIPILFLTAKTMKEDTLEGFRSGGDDYMTKPFSMEELLMRMEVILKRSMPEKENEVSGPASLGKFTFDPDTHHLDLEGKEIKLTTKESQLLQLLVQHKNEVLDRQEALLKIWGDDTYHNGRSMDVYITKLRKHLKEDDRLEIVNVHGQGFRLLERS